MTKKLWIHAILIVTLLSTGAASAMEPPALQVKVTPPFSDRRFPFIIYGQTWEGTPVQSKDVAVPNVFIVYGKNEDTEVIAASGRIGFYLGNWVTDMGFSVREVHEQQMPPLFITDKQIPSPLDRHLIVVGRHNRLTKTHKVIFEAPSVIHKQSGDTQLLFVGGKTRQETLKAVGYLADVRLNFKSGAYKTFFSYIKLRGYIEKENNAAALATIKSPLGLSACGRNMTLAAPAMGEAPEKIRKHIQYRNTLLYEQLPEAVKGSDKVKALQVWQAAMKTCYACHQGTNQIPQLRKFKPLASIHAKHQRIAAEFGFKECTTCHFDETRVKGYNVK
ncbi:MAG: hypothetical protein R6U38_03310 [Desulfatiglandaceae bacterium]